MLRNNIYSLKDGATIKQQSPLFAINYFFVDRNFDFKKLHVLHLSANTVVARVI